MMNFAIIFICGIAGIFARKLRQFPSTTAQALNAFVIYISLPALIFSQIPKLLSNMRFEGLWWIPVSMAWMSLVLSFLFFWILGKKLKWSHAKMGALVLTAGLGNTSFVGFPLLEALMGPQSLPIGIMVDQPGTFLALSTFGIVAAALFSGAQLTASRLARRVFTFPPFLSLVLSVFWFLMGLKGHAEFAPLLDKLASTLIPLALFAVGFQLKLDWHSLKRRWQALAAGLSFKLILIPFFFSLFYMKGLGGYDLATQITILESAMAPMVTSAVVANEFNLDSELANLMVGVGIPLSLITVPLWKWILGF